MRERAVAVRPGDRRTGGRLVFRRRALSGVAFPGHQQTRYTGTGNGPVGWSLCHRMPNEPYIGASVHVYPPCAG
jgi:hypothetical protein